MIFKVQTAIVILFLAVSCFAGNNISIDNTVMMRPTYPSFTSLTFSPQLNIRSGSESIIGINHAIYQLEDRLIETKWFNENTIPLRVSGIICRFAKYIYLDGPADYFSVVFAHEYLGHGARYRELDISNIDYGFEAPPPYGDGGGHASANIDASTITDHELAVIFMGGFEVQTAISSRLNLRFMAERNIHYREAILYFESLRINMDYLQSTNNTVGGNNNKDAAEYIRILNGYAGYTDPDNLKMDMKYLKSHYYLNLANPFLCYSLYSMLKTYLWDGNSTTAVPMIHAEKFDYLPSLRAAFTPFGLEYHLENYLRFKNKVALIDIRYGDQKLHKSWGGLGLLIQNFYQHERYSLDIDLNLWKQPGIEIGRENASLKGDGVGAAFSIRGYYNFSDARSSVAIFVELGYKSAGFLEGHELDASPIILLGFGYWN